MSAIEVLQALQDEVGSRRAGTEGELKAQKWLSSRCESLGLAVELDKFRFIGTDLYRPLFQLAILVSVAVSIALSSAGRWSLGGAILLLVFLYLNLIHNRIDVRLARAESYNVIAGLNRPLSEYVADPEKGPAFLICAHYDTARNSPPWTPRLRDLMRFLGPLALLGIVLYALFLVLQGVGYLLAQLGVEAPAAILERMAPWMMWLVGLAVVPLALLTGFSSLSALFRKKTDSPGADDNGSGTAAVLELARRLKDSPPPGLELFFAWWGAEELGLFGSRQFVRRFDALLDKGRLYVLNIDCVGVGRLMAVLTGKGVIRRRATDPTIIRRVESVAKHLGVETIRTWESIISGGSSDHAEWVDRGYKQAFSLLREDYRAPSLPARVLASLLRIPDANQLGLRHIHLPVDTIEVIDPQVLQETTNVAEAYVRAVAGEISIVS